MLYILELASKKRSNESFLKSNCGSTASLHRKRKTILVLATSNVVLASGRNAETLADVILDRGRGRLCRKRDLSFHADILAAAILQAHNPFLRQGLAGCSELQRRVL